MSRSVSIIVLCAVFFSGTALRADIQKPHPSPPASYNATLLSPLFSGVPLSPFHNILTAYHAGDVSLAITRLKTLQQKGKNPEVEIAAYFLGELYLKQAEQGNKEAVSQAMVSYQDAIHAYPQSRHVLLGYLQIGKIYARQKLFYEAIGAFDLILERPHPDPFTWKAGLEIAKAYQAWGKWLKAKTAYEAVLRNNGLPKEVQIEAMFGYADVLYQLGQFEQAYRYYEDAALASSTYRYRDPHALFQYGESAYRTRHFEDAKTLLLDFYNIYPNAPLASMALLRARSLLQVTEQQYQVVTPNLSSLSETFTPIIATPSNDEQSESFHLGRILLALEALKECDPAREQPQKDPFLADDAIFCDMPLKREAFLRSSQWGALHIEKIRTHIFHLLENTPSTTAQGVLIETIHQLKRYKAIGVIAEIEAGLLMALPTISPYRMELEQMLDNTLVKEWAPRSDPVTLLTFFHAYSPAFTKKMLREDIGFIMGMSHLKAGLLEKAAELLQSVSHNYKHPLSDEALYQLGEILLTQNENEQAKRIFEQYQNRFQAQRGRVLAHLGDIAFRQKRIEEAVSLYQHWLLHHPKHPHRSDVYVKLSDVHRFRNDFDSEIKVYQQWIQNDSQSADPAYMKLSDAYFQAGQYEKATTLYRWILDHAKEGKNRVEWIQFRLGQAYAFMGDAEKGQTLFRMISKNGRDPLIRKMAEENLRPAQANPPPFPRKGSSLS